MPDSFAAASPHSFASAASRWIASRSVPAGPTACDGSPIENRNDRLTIADEPPWRAIQMSASALAAGSMPLKPDRCRYTCSRSSESGASASFGSAETPTRNGGVRYAQPMISSPSSIVAQYIGRS